MFPFEKDPAGDRLWELGLDFTVSPGKTDFQGAEAHRVLKARERFKIFGVLIEGTVAADMGDIVYAGYERVGVIACAMVSTLTQRSMAIARLDVAAAVHGTPLTIDGRTVNGPAIAHTLPFDDPKKSKRNAVG
jgi:aminomethyltransferase